MKYFCETKTNNTTYYFISDYKPKNEKINSYCLIDDGIKILDLEKNVTILNSLGMEPPAHSLLYVYMLLSELCSDESSRSKFSELASSLARKHIDSLNSK